MDDLRFFRRLLGFAEALAELAAESEASAVVAPVVAVVVVVVADRSSWDPNSIRALARNPRICVFTTELRRNLLFNATARIARLAGSNNTFRKKKKSQINK